MYDRLHKKFLKFLQIQIGHISLHQILVKMSHQTVNCRWQKAEQLWVRLAVDKPVTYQYYLHQSIIVRVGLAYMYFHPLLSVIAFLDA